MKPLEQILYGVGMALFWIIMSKISGFDNTVFIALSVIYISVLTPHHHD